MPRAELEDLVKRYRRVWRRRHQYAPYSLHWQRSGAVWAMDFSEPPQPIEGISPYLFAVRDLASHQQLLWLPVFDSTAATTIERLGMPSVRHGPPLVLEADKRPHF